MRRGSRIVQECVGHYATSAAGKSSSLYILSLSPASLIAHVFEGDAINAVGRTHCLLRQYQDALAAQEHALRFFFQVLPPNHPRIAYQFLQIGHTLAHTGNFHQAVKRAAEAIRIYESASLPSSHPSVQAALGFKQLWQSERVEMRM